MQLFFLSVTSWNVSAGGLSYTSTVSLSNDQQLQYGPSFKELEVLVQPQTAQTLHVNIAPKGQQRWRVPESIVPRCVCVSLRDAGGGHLAATCTKMRTQSQTTTRHQTVPMLDS